LILDALPEAKELPADCGYDSDKFRAALIERGITPCIPPRKNRKVQHHYCKTLYTQRHKIKNMFSRLKDWRRIAMRYDRCAHTFLSAINIDATHHILDQSMSPDLDDALQDLAASRSSARKFRFSDLTGTAFEIVS
jgi:transposase